jgi:phenylpropionate dioxygenase-like ring-hydroxylating dioxygenase large terminal subunit
MVANETATPKHELGSNERFPVLFRGWYPACLSSELRVGSLLPVVVYDRQFVVFRTLKGEVAALLDRCPHRNVPLSAGRVCADGTVECAYHGWRFDKTGSCRLVPGLATLPDRSGAKATSAVESGGLVWIWADPESRVESVPALPDVLNTPGYTTVRRHVSAPASLYRTVENALDVPHTSVLHRGLFRSGERQRISVTVRRFHDRAEAEYVGERPPSGALSWVLTLGLPRDQKKLTVQHWDRFILPSTLQVEYRLGSAAHFLITAYCRPVSVRQTDLFVVASFRTSFPGALVQLGLEPLGRIVFRQDRRILGLQTEAFVRQGPPAYYSTALDTLGQEIWRLLKSQSSVDESADEADGGGGTDDKDSTTEPQFQRTFELLA